MRAPFFGEFLGLQLVLELRLLSLLGVIDLLVQLRHLALMTLQQVVHLRVVGGADATAVVHLLS